jgi:serine protease Do
LRCFQLSAAVELEVGDRVLAFSNLYGVATGDEDASVLHGHVAARTSLAGRRGVYRTPYRGTAYILDAMTNNPGSAGGALTDRRGRLAGMLGKELRNVQDNTWLNYALPVGELSAAVADLIAGKARPRDPSDTSRKPREPATLASLGIVLVPDVLSKTPPFVDRVISGSAADKAGVRPDDLVLLVNDHTVTSVKAMVDELSFIDRIDEVRLVLQRDQELLQVSLFATGR